MPSPNVVIIYLYNSVIERHRDIKVGINIYLRHIKLEKQRQLTKQELSYQADTLFNNHTDLPQRRVFVKPMATPGVTALGVPPGQGRGDRQAGEGSLLPPRLSC